MQLRDYQKEAIDDELIGWFRSNKTGNPVVNACVGAGKSIMLAYLCDKAVNGFKRKARVLMVVPSKELCEQNYNKLMLAKGNLNIGVMSASLGIKDDVDGKDVVIGTIGTLHKQGIKLGFFNLILIDEAHLVNRKNQGMYRELVKTLSVFNPNIRVVGWTGTPFRYDGVWITEGKDRLFTDIPVTIGIKQLLDEGYLTPLKNGKTNLKIASDGLTVRNGDFVVSELEALLDKDDINKEIAREIKTIGENRKKLLVFCVTVKHAEHMAEALNDIGIKSVVISGETPKAQREDYINKFRNGDIRCVCNCAVLTTGFDLPEIDLIALIRNTKSKVLYTQICGRGMRVAEGKHDCLWLDFTDTTKNLGPVDLITGISEKQKKQGGGAPFKFCPECEAGLHASALICPECGYEFPAPAPKINITASHAAILSKDYEPEWVSVDRVTYSRWPGKDGKPDTMRVDYWNDSGLWPVRIASEFIRVFHPVGWAREQARKWGALTGIDIEIVKSRLERDKGPLEMKGSFPKFDLLLDTRGKYPKILDYGFSVNESLERVAV